MAGWLHYFSLVSLQLLDCVCWLWSYTLTECYCLEFWHESRFGFICCTSCLSCVLVTFSPPSYFNFLGWLSAMTCPYHYQNFISLLLLWEIASSTFTSLRPAGFLCVKHNWLRLVIFWRDTFGAFQFPGVGSMMSHAFLKKRTLLICYHTASHTQFSPQNWGSIE